MSVFRITPEEDCVLCGGRISFNVFSSGEALVSLDGDEVSSGDERVRSFNFIFSTSCDRRVGSGLNLVSFPSKKHSSLDSSTNNIDSPSYTECLLSIAGYLINFSTEQNRISSKNLILFPLNNRRTACLCGDGIPCNIRVFYDHFPMNTQSTLL